jgi:hypothetical protein
VLSGTTSTHARALPSATQTLFAPVAINASCGFLPATRDSGCFPALLNWMYSQWQMDRNDYFLRMSSTNVYVNKETALSKPGRVQYVSSAQGRRRGQRWRRPDE